MVITFHLNVRFSRIKYQTLKIEHENAGQIQTATTFGSVYDWFPDISRHSKLNNRTSQNWTQKLSAYSNGHNVWLRCMYEAHYISGCSTMNSETSWEIQVVIPFHLDVRFRRIICRDARNWTQTLSAYSNGHNFRLGCMYEAHDISGCSTMNNGSSREIQMVITFHSGVRFRRIIYRDARKRTAEALEKFKWSKLFTRRSDWGA